MSFDVQGTDKSWDAQGDDKSSDPQGADNDLRRCVNCPAAVTIMLGGNVMLFGGKQFKVSDGEYLFPDNAKTQLFVDQCGPDHTPHIGITLTLDHDELQGVRRTAAFFEVQTQVKPATSYRLSFAGPISKATILACTLDPTADGEEFTVLPHKAVHPSIVDANNKGAKLVPIVIEWAKDKPAKSSFDLVTLPRSVAKGPNHGIVHDDEPFDGGVSISKILSATRMILYIPQGRRDSIMELVSHGMTAPPIDPAKAYGIAWMRDYDRQHVESISEDCWLTPSRKIIHPTRVTDFPHFRTAGVWAMALDTLPLQQDIEKLAGQECQVILVQGEHGKLYAGVQLPRGEFEKLLDAVNKDGQEFQILTEPPVPWDPKSGKKKPKLDEREPFPARILGAPPAGVNMPSNCDIIAQVFPRRITKGAIGKDAVLSDMVTSDGKTWVVLYVKIPDETAQTKRSIARYTQALDPVAWIPDDEQKAMGYEEYCRIEMQKSATRDMLCGRGARKRVYVDGEAPHVEQPSLPYPGNKVDLLKLIGADGEDERLSIILSETVQKLGAYSELVQILIRDSEDAVVIFEAFPGAGKTTVTGTIAELLCMLSDNEVKILVIAGQHAALNALNINLSNRLTLSVPALNQKFSKKPETDPSARPVHYPLLLRAFGNDHDEMMEFVRIVGSKYKSRPDAAQPNTLCELLLQLTTAGPHRLPEFAKPQLTALASSIEHNDSEGFRKLRQFVAGDLTWDQANKIVVETSDQTGSLQQKDRSSTKDIRLEEGHPHDVESDKTSKKTSEQKESGKDTGDTILAQDALKRIIDLALPLVNVLMCTTAAAAGKAYKNFVANADICQVEEAGAMSAPQVFAGWRGIGQPIIISGDGAQFGPFMRDYKKHIFRQFLATPVLDLFKTAQYPVFQLSKQHRAVDGQFEPLYENFYSEFASIESPDTQHPGNHPDAQRVEAAFVSDFAGLEPSPAGLILPMFIHVPNSVCEYMGKSKYSPQQTKAATYVVQKLIASGVPPAEIMVIGGYRAQIMELRKSIHKDVLVTTVDGVQGQERFYVVSVFGTNKDVGPGFTNNCNRLCVSMSRQKYFLALVGDINTVDYANISPDSKDENVHIANVHRYFVDRKRVGRYEEDVQGAVQDAAQVPEPFTTTLRDDSIDEQKARLRAQIEAATAALAKLDASESCLHVAQPSVEPGPSHEEETITKPMTLEEEMDAFMLRARKPTPRATSSKATDAGPSDSASTDAGTSGWASTDAGTSGWASTDAGPSGWPSTDAGLSGSASTDAGPSGWASTDAGPSGWPSTDAGPSDSSLNASADAAPSGFENASVDDDTPNFLAMKCKSCGDRGHYANECPKKDPIKCFNCGGVGHISKACPNPPKKRDPPTCYNCYETGHMKAECTNEKRVKCINCDEIGHYRKDCPKPTDYTRVQCRNCGEMGHGAARCQKPAQSQPSQPSQGAGAGFDVVDSTGEGDW